MGWAYVRLWYLTTTFLAVPFYADPVVCEPVVLVRPHWAPVWLLQQIWRWNHTFLACMVLLGLLLTTDLVVFWWLRLGFCLFALLVDLGCWAAYNCHPGYIFIYTSLAMVLPPGEHQSGVLRMIVAHQLGSPAICKLRIGGVELLKATTIEFFLRWSLERESTGKPHALIEPTWMRQRWLISACLRNPWLLQVLTVSGPLVQLGVALGCFFGSGYTLYATFVAACGFHLANVPLLGIFFPFNIPCYMLALLPDSAQHMSCLLNIPTLVTALLLFSSTLFMLVDWPLSAIILFPYNTRQINALESFMGRYLLAHSEGKVRESSFCITERCVAPCPSNFIPGHFKAIQSIFTSELSQPLDPELLAKELSEWLRRSRRFVDYREQGQMGRCFDEVMVT